MGKVIIPHKVRLFCAICYANEQIRDHAKKILISEFGQIDYFSDPFDFTFTNYYSDEMGGKLMKIFYSFSELVDPAGIAEIKLTTNTLEKYLSFEGKRTVNIDPGYLEAAKIVLATTKNFSHRVYLEKGIYGDVQLFFQKGRFQTNEWTYPDYKMEETIAFFVKLRKEYLDLLSKNTQIVKEKD